MTDDCGTGCEEAAWDCNGEAWFECLELVYAWPWPGNDSSAQLR